MIELSKRLQKSLSRIERCGGVVLIHHTSMGSVDFQLPNGGGAFASHRHQASGRWAPSAGQGRYFRWRRSNPACGEHMSFTANIEARIAIINKMIANASIPERRKLQKERSDLEAKLEKAKA